MYLDSIHTYDLFSQVGLGKNCNSAISDLAISPNLTYILSTYVIYVSYIGTDWISDLDCI